MRKLLVGVVLSLLLVTPVFAKNEQVAVEGTKVTLDVQEKNGRKLYPLRSLCEALDIEILDAKGDYINLQQGDNGVTYIISAGLISNQTGYFKCDVNAMSIKNTTYVPIRSIAYMFGYDIDMTDGMSLSKKAEFVPPTASTNSKLLGEDLYVIGVINDYFEEDYYISGLEDVIANGDIGLAQEMKSQVLQDKADIKELGAGLQTQTAKSLYKEYLNVLNAYADLFTHIQSYGAQDAAMGDAKNINAIEIRMNKKLEEYIKIIGKQATLIK